MGYPPRGIATRQGHMCGLERAFVNSRWKRHFQRWEVHVYRSLLAKAGLGVPPGTVLDAGCGAGFGLELIRRTWAPRALHGIDLDPDEARRAAALNPGATVQTGSLLKLPYADSMFDAVFVFGVLHHISEWGLAVSELSRVLRSGGVLCINEHNRASVSLMQRIGIEQQEGGLF